MWDFIAVCVQNQLHDSDIAGICEPGLIDIYKLAETI